MGWMHRPFLTSRDLFLIIKLKANLILLVTDEYTCLVRPKKEKKKCQAVVVASWILHIHVVVGDQKV